ncbi:MAG: putative outer membrane repeat protein [Granulosicoccus sp.]
MLEVLEPRVLYSADSVGSLLPLLLPDELDTLESLGTSLLFDAQSVIDENDLLPEPLTDTDSVKHVVFIDSAVPEFDALRNSAESESTTVIIIDAYENGVSVISQTLAQHSSLNSIQIISHGASGQLFLGNQNVDEQVLWKEQPALSRWSNALSDGGDILLLGCDVAAGEDGNSFVQQLALLTGADVAASDDLSGHASLKADWDLEISSGPIEAVVQLDSNIQSNWSYKLGDIEVDTTLDKFDAAIQNTWDVGTLISHRSANNGFEVSLREALYVAQNLPDIDVITLPGGVFTLTLTSGDADGKWGDLNVSEDTSIIGENSLGNPTVINQDVVNQRIFTANGGTLLLESLTIANADTSLVAGGGAIYSAGSVVLIDSILENNSSGENGGAVATQGDLTLERTRVLNNSSEKSGGALYADGELTILESIFTGNSSLDDGGAVYANGDSIFIHDSGFTANFTDSVVTSGMIGNGGAVAGTADIEILRSSFDNNETRNVNLLSKGGAVYHEGSGTLSISDVTFSANSSVSGGAIYTDQTASVSNATFVGNEATLTGSAIQSDGGIVHVGSSIFSGNEFVNPPVVGPTYVVTGPQYILAGNVASEGFNLYDFDPTSQMALGTGDLVNTTAGSVATQLDALSELDGSYVKVHALNEGSQAINAGRVPISGAEDSQGMRRDQVTDIGASEYNSASSIVYWADAAGGIFRSDADFSNVQQILFGATNPNSIKVDESSSKIYWLTNGAGNGSGIIDLMSASLDGISGETTLLSNLVAASSLALNSAASHLYVAFAGNTPRVDRYDMQDLLATPVTVVTNNGGNITSINQNQIILDPEEMVFNATTEKLFWSEQGNGNASSIRIFDVALNSIDLMAATANSIAVNPEGTSVFWTDTTADSIAEFDSDSATLNQTPVDVADTNPAGIAYAKSEDLLVWISDAASSISSTNVEDKTLQARYEHSLVVSDVATMRTTTVTAIPVITTNSDMTVPEGSARLLPKTNLIATDPDTDVGDIVYTVTRIPLHGYLTLSGNLTSSFTQQDLDGDLVNYIHDGTETLTDQMEFQLSDGINSSDRFKYDIQLIPVNDAPTLRVEIDAQGMPLKMPIQEAGTYVLNPAVLIGFDAETTPAALIYHITSAVSAGSFTVEGVEATSFTGTQLATGFVQFEHDGSENIPDSLQIKLVDGSASDAESGTVTLDFEYVPQNDSPVLTTIATSVFENGNVQITNQNLVIEDPDLGFGNIIYNLSEIPSHGAIEVLGRGLLLSTAATFTQIELNSGLVFYTPNVNNAEDETYQLVFVATDPEGGSSGPVPMGIVVTGVNNTPILTTVPFEVEEGRQFVLTGANFDVSDPDSFSQSWELSYRDTEEMNGSISIYNQSDEPDSDGYSYFSYRDLLIGNVAYNHDGSEGDSAQIAFRISDGTSTSEEVALHLSVTPVNDTPSLSISNTMISVDEGGQYVFQSADFSFTDSDAIFAEMRIYVGASENVSGAITVAGASVDSFTLADLANGQVVYTHDGSEPDITGTGVSFTFRMGDGQSESPPVVLNIAIEPQNDLPVFTFEPAGEPIKENTPGLVVGEIRFTDSDTGDTVEFWVSDDRFVLTPLVGNVVQVALGETDVLDFEEDTRFEASDMRLEITAIDSNPAVQRPAGYQGVQQEESLEVGDVNYAPVIDMDAVPTQVSGSDFVFDNKWVTDQGNDVGELNVTAALVGGGDLPSWLVFNPSNRVFDIDLKSPELTNIEVVINVGSAVGSVNTNPIFLTFGRPIELAPAQPVVEPVEPEKLELFEPEPVAPIIEPADLSELLSESTSVSEELTETTNNSEFKVTIDPETESLLDSDRVLKNSADEEALNDELNGKVDLHDLIKPLASIGDLQLAVLDTAVGASSGDSGGSKIIQDMDMSDLNDIFGAARAELEAQSALMARAMDNKEVTQDDRSAASRALFGTSTGISTGLSVGYLIWLVRGGALMGSVLSSLPAWRFVDPLPVLGSLSDDMENDEESLESIVENEGVGKIVTQVEAAQTLGVRLANVFSWKR